ncbi:MAG: deoxyribodipyrimidine photolyase [Planctomycetes bacterium]|nr:deoxyribodipyrimidine photolyase [Planctomycetota bacterium]
MSAALALRLRAVNAAPERPERAYVLYWMTASRRVRWSHALDRAVERARALGRPLVILEALRAGYPHASDRLHRFVLDGMADTAARLEGGPVRYHAYVEPAPGAGKGLLAALAARACLVVTDDWPCFFLPRMLAAAARQVDVRLEAVDGNGLLPLRAADRTFTTARSLRAFLQKVLPAHLAAGPRPDPLARAGLAGPASLPAEVLRRWPAASAALLRGEPTALAALPIDHAVPPAPMRGGWAEAERRLARFVAGPLGRYAVDRDAPGVEGTSRLSPYLHFGHTSAHRVLDAVARAEGWTPARLAGPKGGAREGWWGVSPSAEAFLDQLVTWRELAFNTCARRPDDYDRYDALPAWARETLEAHAGDPRPHLYDLDALEGARTHDPLWNAAQRQLLREGWFHGYLRMLWGKKLLEWSPHPRDALARMAALMDRWSLDGRDPNSYAGYAWVLGRYDRAWPSRPVFGKVRSMSSARTAAKVDVTGYLARYGPA